MHQQKSARRYSQLSALTGVAALSLVALVGCSGGSGSSESPASTTSSASDPSSSSTNETSTSERTEESEAPSTSSSAAAAPAGSAGALTPPGTKLKLGQPANTHANTGNDPKDAKYKTATFITKVTKIVPGSSADLSAFKDAAKYAGQTPYYVYTETTLTSLSKPTAGMSAPSVDAQLKDGSDAQKLIVFGSFDKCESTQFDTTGKGDALSLKVGSTAISCSVFLAPKGDQISSVSYTDPRFSYVKYSDNQYQDNPIVWSK
ncbi:cytoskeletal protein RodZ [Psychromicrobium silvestre]|uniref:Cytoskeletal protein RodZ n=1 Tax=Psychromicrobium silvestre TaxID=1645614 RepID=A0A7Y9LUM6_9MICC|nr:hypothetical protein [Psychromicrobium silvestre]NYE95923.1 cytoskeletal protein RodZ [Psychromicrobium silvestre]